MSNFRRLYYLGYILMLLGLAALYFLPAPEIEYTPEEHLRKLDAWLGSSYGRTELDAAPWKPDGDDFCGVIFTFRDSAEELNELKRRHNLKEGRVISGLPSGWQEQIDTTRPIYTAPPRVLIKWHLSDWGYDTRDFMLASLKDGRSLLALRYKATLHLKGRTTFAACYEVPDYEGKLLPFWYMALVIIGIIAFSLLVPLGGLLLFPNFRLKQKGSGLKWFGMATIFPLATIVPFFIPNLATDTDIISTLILPVQLAGAAILYVIVVVIQRRGSKSARATAYIKQ